MTEIVYGHPVIPADTEGLPACGSGRHYASELSAELLQVLADAVAENLAYNQVPQTIAGPESIVSVTVQTNYSFSDDVEYVVADVEARDTDGAAGGYTFTVT